MKKRFLIALLVLAALAGIWASHRSEETSAKSSPVRGVTRPGTTPDADHKPARALSEGERAAASAALPAPAKPSAQASAHPHVDAKDLALLQQVGMAVAELPEVRAGLEQVKVLHAELAHASAERQAAIDVELKAIEARHTEFYREAFRNLGMPESQVRGIQISLPKPPKPEVSAPPAAGQPAQPTFQ